MPGSPASEPSAEPYILPEEDLRLQGDNNRGYFPVWLGLRMEDNRYCIVRKLGWGQYSSVWLARDRTNECFVAIKIFTHKATEALEVKESNELDSLRTIATSNPSHRGFRYNMLYYDTFKLNSPHGEHQCIVTEPLGPSLDCLRDDINHGQMVKRPNIVRLITKQLLMGLEYLHNECHIIHGNLEHINILFRPKSLDDLISHQLAYVPSRNYDYDVELPPEILPIISQPLPLTIKDNVINSDQLEAVLADFGSSHPISHVSHKVIHPDGLVAPEVVLGYKWETPADIWNLGCIVIELLSGCWVFDSVPSNEWSCEEDYLARVTEVLERKFELDFLNKCGKKSHYFKEDGTFAHFTEHESLSPTVKKILESCLDNETERETAERFILRCLQLTPEMRPTATQLLDDPWLHE